MKTQIAFFSIKLLHCKTLLLKKLIIKRIVNHFLIWNNLFLFKMFYSFSSLALLNSTQSNKLTMHLMQTSLTIP